MYDIPMWAVYTIGAVAVLAASAFFKTVLWEKSIEEVEEEQGAVDAT